MSISIILLYVIIPKQFTYNVIKLGLFPQLCIKWKKNCPFPSYNAFKNIKRMSAEVLFSHMHVLAHIIQLLIVNMILEKACAWYFLVIKPIDFWKKNDLYDVISTSWRHHNNNFIYTFFIMIFTIFNHILMLSFQRYFLAKNAQYHI